MTLYQGVATYTITLSVSVDSDGPTSQAEADKIADIMMSAVDGLRDNHGYDVTGYILIVRNRSGDAQAQRES